MFIGAYCNVALYKTRISDLNNLVKIILSVVFLVGSPVFLGSLAFPFVFLCVFDFSCFGRLSMVFRGSP